LPLDVRDPGGRQPLLPLLGGRAHPDDAGPDDSPGAGGPGHPSSRPDGKVALQPPPLQRNRRRRSDTGGDPDRDPAGLRHPALHRRADQARGQRGDHGADRGDDLLGTALPDPAGPGARARRQRQHHHHLGAGPAPRRGWERGLTVPARLSEALADRYAFERELGQGGMATVYLADDIRHQRKVAIKVLRPDLAATIGPDRFFREIRIAAQLQHPHILPLLESGEAAGYLFYVMPYVEGQSVRERLARSGELPVHEAVRLLTEIVDALSYAHARGVGHRDVKPDNVMLSGRHALVMDFGVAKAVSEASGRNQLTTAGVALGTPAYMAPEQAAADPNLDHRVDIYAVGAMAYELLAGRPPFVGGTPQQVLAAHVTQAPEPL